LKVSFKPFPPCSVYLAELKLECGLTRHLHVDVMPSERNLSNLTLTVDPLAVSEREYLASVAGVCSTLQLLPSFFPPENQPTARGFGLEIELLTLDPARRGFATKQAEIEAAIQQLEQATEKQQLTSIFRWRELASRLRQWEVGMDKSVSTFTPHTAKILAGQYSQGPEVVEELSRERGFFALELRSPLPPNELSLNPDEKRPFPWGSAAEVIALLHLLRHVGIAAPDSNEKGSAAGLHVHVNVANPDAAGRILTHREILSVWQAWVVYDLAISRLSRSWRWRDKWAAPLYATGAEYSFEQKPWQQGEVLRVRNLRRNDVPAFVQHCHGAVRSERFDGTRDPRGALEALFSPDLTPGKHVSLNLNPVTTYGTVEFRRMQSSTDEASVLRWAHFCTRFVEVFASRAPLPLRGACPGWGLFVDAPTAGAALAELAAAQAGATLPELAQDMGLPAEFMKSMLDNSCH